MNKEKFKKIFYRFLKDNGIYSFITGEIKKEHGNFDNFYYKVRDEKAFWGIFSLRSILSFPWEGRTLDIVKREKSFEFWFRISHKWYSLMDGLISDY